MVPICFTRILANFANTVVWYIYTAVIVGRVNFEVLPLPLKRTSSKYCIGKLYVLSLAYKINA